MGQIFFGLACALACVTSRAWTSTVEPMQENVPVSLGYLGKWLIISLVLQLLLGAAIRHDDKGALLRDGKQAVFLWHLAAHVLGAFYVIYRGMILMIRVFRQHRTQKPIIVPTRWLMYLLGLQFLLGVVASILKVLTGPSYELSNEPPTSRVIFATAHQIVSALMLGLAVCVTMYAVRLLKPAVLEQKQ
jgi:heme A synthase